MINMCPYCNLDTAGNHEWNCPLNSNYNKQNEYSKNNIMGWECPKCGSVYAWYDSKCPNHGPKIITSNSSNSEYEIKYNCEGAS